MNFKLVIADGKCNNLHWTVQPRQCRLLGTYAALMFCRCCQLASSISDYCIKIHGTDGFSVAKGIFFTWLIRMNMFHLLSCPSVVEGEGWKNVHFNASFILIDAMFFSTGAHFWNTYQRQVIWQLKYWVSSCLIHSLNPHIHTYILNTPKNNIREKQNLNQWDCLLCVKLPCCA